MEITAYDGDYEIIFNGVFNIYENKLTVKNLMGFEFVFEFTTDSGSQSKWEIMPGEKEKSAIIKLTNFKKPLGIGMIKKIPILTLETGHDLYFSLHSKSLNDTTSFIQVSLTFYKK